MLRRLRNFFSNGTDELVGDLITATRNGTLFWRRSGPCRFETFKPSDLFLLEKNRRSPSLFTNSDPVSLLSSSRELEVLWQEVAEQVRAADFEADIAQSMIKRA